MIAYSGAVIACSGGVGSIACGGAVIACGGGTIIACGGGVGLIAYSGAGVVLGRRPDSILYRRLYSSKVMVLVSKYLGFYISDLGLYLRYLIRYCIVYPLS